MNSKYNFHHGKSGSAITVRISPRAKQNEISGILSDGTIKIHLIAPPEDGKANAALIKFLAEIFEIPPANIEIIAGFGSKDKLLSIIDLDAELVQEKIYAKIK
jgi:uncharacterized protein